MSNSFLEFCEDFLYGRGACGDCREAALRAVKYGGSAFGEGCFMAGRAGKGRVSGSWNDL
jgi:hypothetical protein